MEININLIPPYRKEEIIQSNRLKSVINSGITVFIIAAMFFAFLVGLDRILDFEYKVVLSNQEADADRSQYDKIKEYDGKFTKINADTQQIINIRNDQLYWSHMFVALSDNVLDGIEITDLSTKNFSVFLVGKANNRDNLLAFKKKLEEGGCFSSVALPLSNLVSQENVDFQMDLSVKEECIKNK